MRRVAGGHEFVRARNRFELAKALQRCVGPIAFVPGHAGRPGAGFAGLPVLDRHFGLHGNDFVVETTGVLGRCRALLALERVGVLRLAGNAVARGDDIGGVDHGHVDRRLVFAQPAFPLVRLVETGLDQRNALHAAGDCGADLAGRDCAGGRHDGLKTRGAEAVHGLPGRADRQSGAQRALARDIESGGAFGEAAAHYDVVDLARLKSRAGESVVR